jgi:hypothetical protein
MEGESFSSTLRKGFGSYCMKDGNMMTQSLLSTHMELLGLLLVSRELMSHIYMEGDRERDHSQSR